MHSPGSSEHSPSGADGRLLDNLNPEQLAAVTLPAQSALILAGAGSGKTRVLTTRIAWLLQTGQLSPGGVMAVTFTNKAAKEMLVRLGAMLPVNVRGMWIGTFHGLCNRFLRAHWKQANLPQGFQILDSSDQLSAVKRVIKAMNLDEERFVPKQVTWFINGAKDEGLRPKNVEARRWPDVARWWSCTRPTRTAVPARGRGRLRRAAAARLRADARQQAACASTTSHRFQHILVDEFQDTNRSAVRLAQDVRRPRPCTAAVFAVGDDDQSIYAFRGAKVGNMSRLRARVPRRESSSSWSRTTAVVRQHPRRRQHT